jgi:hypothetical protein
VDLEAGALRVGRPWDGRCKKFVEPKTKAGIRAVPLSSWLVAELAAHKARRSSHRGRACCEENGRPYPGLPFAWAFLRNRSVSGHIFRSGGVCVDRVVTTAAASRLAAIASTLTLGLWCGRSSVMRCRRVRRTARAVRLHRLPG